MGMKSWLSSKLGMAAFRAEQAERLATWEFAQANDHILLEADPLRDEVKAVFRLVDAPEESFFGRLLDLANRGSLYSMNHVAWHYAVGVGVTKDLDLAEGWWRRTYEAGSECGLLEYGAFLARNGRTREAEKVYETGWKRGFLPAVYRLIRLRLRPTLPLPERLAWKPALEWAAEQGHPAARYLLSKYLGRGWFGIREIPRGMKLVYAHMAAIMRDDEDRPLIA